MYEALVWPTLTYNANIWEHTDIVDAFHRRQLRELLNVSYPRKITNKICTPKQKSLINRKIMLSR